MARWDSVSFQTVAVRSPARTSPGNVLRAGDWPSILGSLCTFTWPGAPGWVSTNI